MTDTVRSAVRSLGRSRGYASAAGVAGGVVLAVALSRALASLRFGLTPSDPPTYLLALSVLLAVALLACFVPARCASRIGPTIALSSE